MVKHGEDSYRSGVMEGKKKSRDGDSENRSRSPSGRAHKKRKKQGSSPEGHKKSKKHHGIGHKSHSRSSDHDGNSSGSNSDSHKERQEPGHHRSHRKEHRVQPEGRDNLRFDPHRRIKREPEDGHYGDSHHDTAHQQVVSRWEEDEPSRSIKREPPDREQQRHRQLNDDRRRQARRQRDRDPNNRNFGNSSAAEGEPPAEKEMPNFKVSGKLTEDTNMFRGVVVKYNEPPEARKPKRRWRLYGFKGDEALPMLPIHRQSAYLLGRDRRVADIPIDHPSCSKQHAVLQYRLIDYIRPDGSVGRKVRPYVIDLGSANGTFVNNQRIEGQRYVELFERDLIKFGFSTREFVLLHENVDTSELEQNSDTD